LDIRAVEVYVPNEEEEQERLVKFAEVEMQRRNSIIKEAEDKKNAIIAEYATARKKTKAKKKKGISHIQNSMDKLISNLGSLGQPLQLSDSSTSLESDTIDIVVDDAAGEVVDDAAGEVVDDAEEVVEEENNDTNKDD